MALPALVVVEEDSGVLADVERELGDRYSRHYRVLCLRSADEALRRLEELASSGDEVALILAGQVSGTTAGELLDRARQAHPHAKRGLLLGWGSWGDPATGDAIFEDIARGRLDHFVLRPAAEPDELFHQAISSLLLEWAEARLTAPYTVHVVGESWSGRAYELREVLGRCAVPHSFSLAGSDEGRALLAGAGGPEGLPAVMLPDGRVLWNPSDADLARASGAPTELEQIDFDLVIAGAGPAGLSAAVYGASEGLLTLVIDEGGIGGQATSSSLIRNYLGFPRGLSGRRLAQQAYEQAWLFRTRFALMQRATGLAREGDRLVVTLADLGRVRARAVVLATGASYRRLGVPELEALNGAGVFYGGTASEAPTTGGEDVYVLGGGNSAGQAALHLARYAREVTLVVRAEELGAGMSDYLVRQVEGTPGLRVRLGTEITGGGGTGWLEHLVLRDRAGGSEETVPADGLFVMIGARPHTDWLPPEVAKDPQGFVLSAADLPADHAWPLEREPLLLETGMPRVFAAGDVRHGSVKRVASAVGEGSVAIQVLHRLFAEDPPRPRERGDAAARSSTSSAV